jgi:hypothetical protein
MIRKRKGLLHNKVCIESLGIFILQENKCSSSTLDIILQKILKTRQFVSLDAKGFVGGLPIL